MSGKKQSFTKRHFYPIGEFWDFLKVRKKWWLTPIVLMLLLVGALIIFAESSAVSPFIYALI